MRRRRRRMEAARPVTDVCRDRDSMVRLVSFLPLRWAVSAGRGGHVVRDVAKSCEVERWKTRAAIAGASRFGSKTRSML